MLILTRKVGEKIVVDGAATIHVIKISGSRVRLGVEAPRDVGARRGELDSTIEDEEKGEG